MLDDKRATAFVWGNKMIYLDHLTIFVADVSRSRKWYTENLGLKIEFEIPSRNVVALQDSGGFTLFVEQSSGVERGLSCVLTFRVADVDARCQELANRNVVLEARPQKLFWGYGAELRDPDGYLVRLWDAVTMREKG
jgi:catechol 2,3-dioxygenase-like lactoylglutathione lyase family enzyme